MTQTESILSHLKSGKQIDPLQALNEYGCFRLAARVKELRDEGHNIKSTKVKGREGKIYAVYWL